MPSGITDRSASAEAPSSIEVRVLLFSVLREHVGGASLTLTLPGGASGDTLLDAFFSQYPELRGYRSVVRLGVNEQYVPVGTPLHDGDDVALITPVSGG